jgi:hypothetical protein
MALVHDDDLTLLDLDGLDDDVVGGCLYFTPIVSIFAFLQSLEALQPDTVLHHLRLGSLKPKVHDVKFGPSEFLPVPISQFLTAVASTRKIRRSVAIVQMPMQKP